MNEFIMQWYSRSIFNFQPSEIKQLFRKIETKSKQLITNNLHQEFNNICLNENLLPIYTNINIYIKFSQENKPNGIKRQVIKALYTLDSKSLHDTFYSKRKLQTIFYSTFSQITYWSKFFLVNVRLAEIDFIHSF